MSGATKQQEIKKARKGRYLQTEMWRSHPETRSPRAAAMPRKCCVSPPFFPRVSRPAIQLGSVGTHSRLHRATRAAGEPDASSSAEVKHELYNHTAVRCRLLCRAAYLKTPKYEGKGGEKTKDTTLKYQQKRARVQMIIKGCLTPSPPAPSADLKSTICSRELLSASWKRLF